MSCLFLECFQEIQINVQKWYDQWQSWIIGLIAASKISLDVKCNPRRLLAQIRNEIERLTFAHHQQIPRVHNTRIIQDMAILFRALTPHRSKKLIVNINLVNKKQCKLHWADVRTWRCGVLPLSLRCKWAKGEMRLTPRWSWHLCVCTIFIQLPHSAWHTLHTAQGSNTRQLSRIMLVTL